MGKGINLCRSVDLIDCTSVLLTCARNNGRSNAAIAKIIEAGAEFVEVIAKDEVNGQIRKRIRAGEFQFCLWLTPHGKIVCHTKLTELIPKSEEQVAAWSTSG